MLNLYEIQGKKYLALLLVCQLGFLFTGTLAIFLLISKSDGIIDVPSGIINLILCVLYGISALWVGLFWEFVITNIFSVSASKKFIFQKRFIRPLLILCLLGAYTTHAMVVSKLFSNSLIVCFSPLLLTGILAIIVTAIILIIVFQIIRNDRQIYIQSQKKIAEFSTKFKSEELRRIELSIELAYGRGFANPLGASQGFTIVGVNSKPWYEISDLPKTALLEDNYEIIRREALEATNNKTLLNLYNYLGVNEDAWDTIELFKEGKAVETINLHFPETIKLLEEISNYIRLETADISVVRPGKIIKPHRDPASSFIICHFGLSIPENCGISVGGESRTWEEGKSIFFDPSYEHTVWNYSDKPRVILLLVFFKPELTDVEMDFVHMLDTGKWAE